MFKQCPHFDRCHEALQSLAIPSHFFNSAFDRCYCSNYCQDKAMSMRQNNETYEMPIGACRFALKISNFAATEQEIFNKWPNGYHGTDSKFLKSIIENGLPVPGTIIQDKAITTKEGHIPNQNHIYASSPSFAYCYSRVYSHPYRFKDREYKFFIQIRQKPEKYENQDNKEYFTTDPDAIPQIGIVVYEVPMHDQEKGAYENTFMEMKKKFPNYKEILVKTIEVLKSIDSVKSDIDRIISSVKSGKNAKIRTNLVNVFGTGLFFLGAAPLGLAAEVFNLWFSNEKENKEKMEDFTKEMKSIVSSLLVIEEATIMMKEFSNLFNLQIEKYMSKEELAKQLVSIAPTGLEFEKIREGISNNATQLKNKNLTVNLQKTAKIQEFKKIVQKFVPEHWNALFKTYGNHTENLRLKHWMKPLLDSSKTKLKFFNTQKIFNPKKIKLAKNYFGKFFGVASFGLNSFDIYKNIKDFKEEGEFEKWANLIKNVLQNIQDNEEKFVNFQKLSEKYDDELKKSKL